MAELTAMNVRQIVEEESARDFLRRHKAPDSGWWEIPSTRGRFFKNALGERFCVFEYGVLGLAVTCIPRQGPYSAVKFVSTIDQAKALATDYFERRRKQAKYYNAQP